MAWCQTEWLELFAPFTGAAAATTFRNECYGAHAAQKSFSQDRPFLLKEAREDPFVLASLAGCLGSLYLRKGLPWCHVDHVNKGSILARAKSAEDTTTSFCHALGPLARASAAPFSRTRASSVPPHRTIIESLVSRVPSARSDVVMMMTCYVFQDVVTSTPFWSFSRISRESSDGR